jgi:NADH:ubiquinone oxidoreductase subunit 4 (subunit M)
LAPLVILVVLLGLYPAPILEATAEPVERILETVQAASGLDLVAWPW